MAARCENCGQLIHRSTDRLRCHCQSMPLAGMAAIVAALERMPDPWPILDTIDIYENRHNGCYILRDREPVPEPDLETWAVWFETAERHVAETDIAPGIRVSTVFLGLDHGFGKSRPLLFETMCFGGPCDQEQDRYTTWQEAEDGHEAMCARVRQALAAAQHTTIEKDTPSAD